MARISVYSRNCCALKTITNDICVSHSIYSECPFFCGFDEALTRAFAFFIHVRPAFYSITVWSFISSHHITNPLSNHLNCFNDLLTALWCVSLSIGHSHTLLFSMLLRVECSSAIYGLVLRTSEHTGPRKQIHMYHRGTASMLA